MHGNTHNSTGNCQDSQVDECQKRLCCIPKVLAVVHVEPEDCWESDCLMKVRTDYYILEPGTLQLNQLPKSALCRDHLH